MSFEAFLPELAALAQVVLIDVMLAGDNAIVVGMAAAGVVPEKRAKVIFWGICAAVVLRILFAAVTTQLLAIIGLTFAGGVLLLWVCWKLFRELRERREEHMAAEMITGGMAADSALDVPRKTIGQAVRQVVLADLSMSLDNVLAVAGAAKEHPIVLVVGLLLSVALMGAAANVIVRLMERWHWLAYVGLAVIGYVALAMIYHGGFEILVAAEGLRG